MGAMMEYLPLLIPVVIIQLALTITALVHILKHIKIWFGNAMYFCRCSSLY